MALVALIGCHQPPDEECALEATPPPHNAPDGTWELAEIPGAEGYSFDGLGWASPSGQIWSIGHSEDASVVAYFDTSSWRLLDTGDINPKSVWASGPDDVWLSWTSETIIEDGAFVGEIWRFDGSDWSLDLDEGGELWGESPGEPWVVVGDRIKRRTASGWAQMIDIGHRLGPPENESLPKASVGPLCGRTLNDVVVAADVEHLNEPNEPLLVHWDGRDWTMESTGEVGIVRLMSCDASDLWGFNLFHDQVAHRSDVGWSLTDLSAFLLDDYPPDNEDGFWTEGFYLLDLWVGGPGDVWLTVHRSAGDPYGEVDAYPRYEVWHFDGCTFSLVATGDELGDGFEPQSVFGSGDDIWIVGRGGRLARFRPS